MRLLPMLTVPLILGIVLAPGTAGAATARDLLKSCDIVVRSMEGSGREVSIAAGGRACWNYMEAVQDMVALADENGHRLLNVCVPEDGRKDGLVRAFTTYAHAHPSELDNRASLVVLQALWAAFPCK